MSVVDEFFQDERLESLALQFDRSELHAANTATYVIHQDVVYSYDAPVTDLRHRLVVVPRQRHGDQRRIAHRFDVRSSSPHAVQHRTDRFGNSIVDVAAPDVHARIEFTSRAVVTRRHQPSCRAAWSAPRPTTTLLTAPDDALR
ncbi:MAG: transglutaminase protein, partial [Ilumatobacteraceae bacterium]|nr:transglutaminase protein [Ilumatobacteraceae bacterium]